MQGSGCVVKAIFWLRDSFFLLTSFFIDDDPIATQSPYHAIFTLGENLLREVRRSEVSTYQQIDDTGARLDGKNIYTIVTCNEEFASFTTSLKKDRLSDTDYYALNTIIKKTRSKKESLLLVLEYPEIPLHNNTSEQDIREKVIQRKIRNCFRSWRGAHASDTFLSLMATCRKQGISFWEYIKDRVYQTNNIPPLAQVISHTLPLAA